MQMGNFEGGEVAAHCRDSAVSCAKMAELIQMQFGCWVGSVQGTMC